MSANIDTREALLSAAKKVFALRGYDGATVKELAEEAGVNISLVSYHFGGKEGLYRACLEHFGRNRLAAAERILKSPESAEDFKVRLSLFVEEFIERHLEERDIATILHRECLSELQITQDLFKEVFVKIFVTLRDFLASAQKSGYLRPKSEIDIHAAAGHFFGGLVHVIRMNTMGFVRELKLPTLDDEAYRKKFITSVLGVFTEGVLKKGQTTP